MFGRGYRLPTVKEEKSTGEADNDLEKPRLILSIRGQNGIVRIVVSSIQRSIMKRGEWKERDANVHRHGEAVYFVDEEHVAGEHAKKT